MKTDEIAGNNLRAFLQQAQLTVIKVPVRQRGLTSSGGHLRCWWNVHALVDVWGGECLLGWHILPKTDYTWHGQHGRGKTLIHHQLFGHAIWINPEGRASCVTKANLAHLTNTEKESGGIIFEKKRQFILFAVAKIAKDANEIPKSNIGIKLDAPELYIEGFGTKSQFEYKNMDLRKIDKRIQKHLIQKAFTSSEIDLHKDAYFSLPSKYTQKTFTTLLKSKKLRNQEAKLSASVIFNLKDPQNQSWSSAMTRDSLVETINNLVTSNANELKKRIEMQSLMRNLKVKE